MIRFVGRERKVVHRQPKSESTGWRMDNRLAFDYLYVCDRTISGSGIPSGQVLDMFQSDELK